MLGSDIQIRSALRDTVLMFYDNDPRKGGSFAVVDRI